MRASMPVLMDGAPASHGLGPRCSHGGHCHVKTRHLDIRAQHRMIVLLLLLVGPSIARAESSAEAQAYLLSIQREFEELEYERALKQIHLARQGPRKEEDEVALSLYEGIIQCDLGKQDQGLAAFRSALALRPDAKLPVQVSPKIEQLFESVRQQVKLELAPLLGQREAEHKKVVAIPQPFPPVQPAVIPPVALSEQASPPRNLRRYSLIPAITGGALVVAGGITWGVSRGELKRLRNSYDGFETKEDVDRSVSRGRTWQTVGVSLLSVGAAGLAAAAGMYVLGAPDKPVSLGVSTNGTSAVIHGRWP